MTKYVHIGKAFVDIINENKCVLLNFGQIYDIYDCPHFDILLFYLLLNRLETLLNLNV